MPGRDLTPVAGAPEKQLVIVRSDRVEPAKISWLWPGRIALGKLTVLVGNPGVSKSTVTCDLAARVSCGAKWADCNQCAPKGSVIVLSAEDDAADTIVPRLNAAGARMKRVHLLKTVRDDRGGGAGEERFFSLTRDIDVLRATIRKIGDVRLVVFDPLTAFMSGVSANSNADVRSVLHPLQAMAEQLGVAIVCVTHMNKSGGRALYRTLGSIGFTAAARSVLAVEMDAVNPNRRLLITVKSNNAQSGTALGCVLKPSPDNADILVVAWESAAFEIDPDAAMKPGKAPTQLSAAMRMLQDLLADREVFIEEIIRKADELGLSMKTVNRAKAELEIRSRKVDMERGWVWRFATTPKLAIAA